MKIDTLTFEIDNETGKVTVTDPWLGRRTLGDRAELIADQLKLLYHYRDDGRKPSKHLLDDIKVYEFILRSQDPEIFAQKYLKEINRLRDREQNISIKKSRVANNLGWDWK